VEIPETRYARIGDQQIAYQVFGQGPTDLLIVSGWFSNVDGIWEEPSSARFLQRLATFSRVIMFDRRGTGASDPLQEITTTTLEAWSDDVRAVMDAAGSERAALLSLVDGGRMAMLFAASYPERTARWSWPTPRRASFAQRVRRAAGIDFFLWTANADEALGEIEEFLTGIRPSATIDRMLATLLFTDIVASTEHLVALGDLEWSKRLDAHHRIVRDQLRHFRGTEITTTGDGFLAAFDGPIRAIECACAIRDGVRDLGIEMRAGLHTGEVQWRGDDLAGISVHIAAKAAPSQVLISQALANLIAGAGITTTDQGTHALKGIPGEWQLLAVSDC
jgi:class 3 adenylate cyclase